MYLIIIVIIHAHKHTHTHTPNQTVNKSKSKGKITEVLMVGYSGPLRIYFSKKHHKNSINNS